MKTVINAAIIEDNRLLLVSKNDVWILPGGKIKGREKDISCLCREVDEELSGTKLGNFKYYNEFDGISPFSKEERCVKVYFANIKGELNMPSNEIHGYMWTSGTDVHNVSEITIKIIDSLKSDGYLK